MRLLALALLLVAACGKDPVEPDPFKPVEVAGTYALQTIKGEALPWTLAEGATSKTEYTGASLVLRANLTFTRTTHHRVTSGASVSETVGVVDGTYTKNDTTGAVVLSFVGTPIPATVEGKTLTVSFAGCCEPWVFQRP